MVAERLTYRLMFMIALLAMIATGAHAQKVLKATDRTALLTMPDDTLGIKSIKATMPDRMLMDSTYNEIAAATAFETPDSITPGAAAKHTARKKIGIRKLDPSTATWIALAIPGGGQIYNRKFWKLPIVYGGFVGCLYAYNWNGQMYKDYRQAYLDIMDSDPNTDSFKDFFRPGYDYESNKEYLKEVFKKRKDRYRRWRDLSIFSFIGVYALSVIDAYVDAQLSNFDISEDINLSIEPQIIDSRQMFGKDYYGFNCNIRF